MSASTIGELLQAQNFTIATAESCTSGLLCHLIGAVPGASAWLLGGWVTYTNELKVSQLGVEQNLIKEHGAVSAQVAAAMAQGAAKRSGADVALSITGIAGPTGGSEAKPVGTIFIGCKVQGYVEVREFRFSGERNAVQEHAALAALHMAQLQLKGEHVASLANQHGEVNAF